MCRESVSIQDSVMAVLLVESSILSTGMLGPSSSLHSCFPEDPDGEFIAQRSFPLHMYLIFRESGAGSSFVVGLKHS